MRVRGYSRSYGQNSKVGLIGQSGSLKSLISSAFSEGLVRISAETVTATGLFTRMELNF